MGEAAGGPQEDVTSDDAGAGSKDRVVALPLTAGAKAGPPLQLAELIKPGPTGTIASTAAVATAAQAARLHTGPCMAPVGLLSALTPRDTSSSTAMQDLLRAAEKALTSGLGDWHLQALQDISPQFEQHVLMGPLGPETLKHKHRLGEPQILRVYGLLHRHCTGFQREVTAAVAGAQHAEQLLAGVWTAFAQLWDECVQVSFQGEVLAAIQELQGTYEALLHTQDVLAGVEQANSALKDRCSEFVRANLDHMLAWRSLKAKADALEGEVSMLSSANSEISLRSAAVAARNTQLTVQLEGMGARLAGAEQQIQDRESALVVARTALLEKDSGLRQLQGQVAELEACVVEQRQGSQRQDHNISQLECQLQQRQQLVQDAERRVADKQRAYNLLHADFAKQKAEAVEAAQRAAQLQEQLGALQQQVEAANQEAAKAHGWRRRWEVSQMHVEDLAAANTRALQRRHELVSSYWPVMARLNQAEDAVAALSAQVLASGQQPVVELPPRDSKAQEVACAELAGTAQTSSSHSTAFSSFAADSSNTQQDAGQEPRNTCCGSTAASASSSGRQQAAAGGSGAAPPDVGAALETELRQLRDSYLLLQEEYWRQKERLLGLEVEGSQLKGEVERASAAATQASARLSSAQQAAAREAGERTRLEADLVGCRSWIRELEKTEQQYLKAIRQHSALEAAASTAQRQAGDLRAALAEAECGLRLAQAAGAAAAQEREQLLQRMAQELNRSTMVEQALQQVHKRDVASGRAVQAQLQEVLDAQASELAVVSAQLAQAQQERDAAASDQQTGRQLLQHAQQHNEQLQQQLRAARAALLDMLRHVERLEARVSFVSSHAISSLERDGGSGSSSSVEVAVEAALHLLERMLASLQCLAADAATISNAAAAAKVEALVGSIMQGLQAAAAAAAAACPAGQRPAVAAGAFGSAGAGIVLLRNAAAVAGKQRCEALEQQLAASRLQLGDASSQLASAASANARLQRALGLRSRAAASLEQQLAAAEQQLQRAAAAEAAGSSGTAQLQHEVAALRLECGQLTATSASRTAELRAAQGRAAAAEAALQQLRASAAAAEGASADLSERLLQAVQASRQDGTAAQAARSEAAAAALLAQQLRQQLQVTSARAAELGDEVKECRHKADICCAAARDAEYRAVETATLLADARRELDFTQHLLQRQQEGMKVQEEQGG